MSLDYRAILQRRLSPRPAGRLDVWSKLRSFALINYAVPKARLEPHLPGDRFAIPEFNIGGQRRALMSAVPFVDVDFHFIRLLPWLKFSFGQTNYRVYVIDRRSGEHAVWFFGTTLGSALVYGARAAWRIPWHPARYQIHCSFDPLIQRHTQFQYRVQSHWGEAQIDLEDTGAPVMAAEGLDSLDELRLILTHPVDGYYYGLDHRLGGYSVWHAPIPLTVGRPRALYFGLYERLGLLSRDEMRQPHSIFLCPEIDFQVFLPPRRLE